MSLPQGYCCILVRGYGFFVVGAHSLCDVSGGFFTSLCTGMAIRRRTRARSCLLYTSLRTAVRETEVAAAEAFHDGAKYTRGDIIEELNRMSSAMHIMMCRYLAGQYQN